MKTITHKLVGIVAALAVAVTWAAPQARAQDTDTGKAKTVAVLSVTSYDDLISDVTFIGKLVEKPGLAQMVEGSLALFTQGQGLAGLDKTKPIGFVAQSQGGAIRPLGFVPVTDLKKLVGAFAGLTGGPLEPNANGVYEIPAQQTIYIQEKGGWAFIAQSEDDLAQVPADPIKLLDGLNKDYDVAVRVYVQNIPAEQRQMAVTQLEQGLSQGLERLPDEDEEQYQLRKQIAENSMKNLVTVINETDYVTFGWQIDATNQSTHIDFELVALPDSKLARQANTLKQSKSDYLGFFTSDAALRFNLTSQTGSEEEVQQALAVIDAARTKAEQTIDEDQDLPDDASRDALKSVVHDATDVLKATIKEGKLDGGMLVKLKTEGVTLAGGGRVADGPKLEAAFKKLAQLAEKEPDFPGVTWDAATHAGVRFHTTQVAVKEEDAQKFLGEKLDVVLGVGEKSIYVALGKDALDTLKSVIDSSKADAEKVVPPMQVAISVGQILKFAAAQEDDPRLAGIAQTLEQSQGKDRVLITVHAIPNGVQYRIEAEQGVLKAIGQAGAAAAGGGGAPPGAFEQN